VCGGVIEGGKEGGKEGKEMIRLGFFMGMVCVWVGRVSAYHLVECACLDESDGVCDMLISTAQEREKRKAVFIKQSVCLSCRNVFIYI